MRVMLKIILFLLVISIGIIVSRPAEALGPHAHYHISNRGTIFGPYYGYNHRYGYGYGWYDYYDTHWFRYRPSRLYYIPFHCGYSWYWC
ncbi:hypothetical protein D6745_04690 [Candidatus Woesearchaeota archaeon]|nr:MAG: hypothetical protein D6745_04690 [Candidatus Woesearchaeota archaeon]